VRQAITQFFHRPPPWLEQLDPTTAPGVAALLDDLRGRTAVGELARTSGKSRFQVARWLRGEAEPRLPDFLLLVESASMRLLDFLDSFTSVAEMPSVAKRWAELEAARRAAYDMPWTQAILRALELSQYRELPHHVPGWIAARLGISPEEEQRCLRLLSRSGHISYRANRWQLRESWLVDTRRDPEAERRVKRWWTEVAIERLSRADNGIFSYNVFAVSEPDLARINDLYRAYFRQIRSIIAQSQPSERVVLASLQMVPLDLGNAGNPHADPPLQATSKE
jgi:hypothetical protein